MSSYILTRENIYVNKAQRTLKRKFIEGKYKQGQNIKKYSKLS